MSKQEVVKNKNYEISEGTMNSQFMQSYGAYTLQTIRNSGVVLYDDFNLENALLGAETLLNEMDAFKKASQESIKQALFSMVTLGLDPMKTQAYFINYGSKLTFQPSYMGNEVLAKRHGASKIVPQVVYQDDVFEIGIDEETMQDVVTEHSTKFANRSGNIIGAYCVITDNEGKKHYTIMTKAQIDKAWAMSSNKSNNKFQRDFADEACKRTVTNRATKRFRNANIDPRYTVAFDEEAPIQDNTERLKATFEEVEQEKEEVKEIMFDFETIAEVTHDENGVIEEDVQLDAEQESIVEASKESEGVGF